MDGQKCTVVEHMHDECHIRCISWRSIIVGALVGVGLSFLLNLFSIAIGLTAFTTTQEGVTAFAVGGFLGFVIGSMASMYVAGWVAGYLGRPYCAKRHLGILYGFATWCLALVFLIALSAPVTRFLASYSSYITNHSITVVQVASEAVVADKAAVVTVDAEKTANDIGKAGLALFALFFLSAFAGAMGGHCGMMSCRKDECSTTVPPRV